MIVFLNGEFVEEQHAAVSVFDRGFLYGDALFETVLVLNRRPFRWEQHWERLHGGAEHLKISIPFGSAQLRGILEELLAKNGMADALVRLMVSRGVGARGYSPGSARQPTVVMTLHPAPIFDQAAPRWRLVTSTVRLPANEPLAQ